MFDRISTINYGKLISSGAAGDIRCYDAKTGTLLWNYTAEDLNTEFTIGNNWWMQQVLVSDGKVYLGHVEHSPNQPLPRGAPFICLDIETGNVVWKMDGGFRQTCWGGKAMIADSIIGLMDTYDQRVYAIGKGPSQTTVDAPATGITLGNSLVIRGMITDVSPGTETYALGARFPNGVPAVSDESMSAWMKYVYMQFERPSDTKGVPIALSVLDANGNYREIGNTTSDADGFFTFSWQPDIPGQYTVYASFTGSESYWPSHATSSFVVDYPATTPAPSAISLQTTYDAYFVPAIVGLFASIVIVAVVLALLVLKKR
jgi:outer membrane protein assembly factor BamB